MEHVRFKANQTAALYVANTLDESALNEFELHMMDCPECLDDVEAWRAIRNQVRAEGPRVPARPIVAPSAPPQLRSRAARVPSTAWTGAPWRVAASLLLGVVLGAAGGWFGHGSGSGGMDPVRTEFFNLPALTRAADECTAIPLGTGTRTIVLRIPGLPADSRVVPADAELQPLAAGSYSTRAQLDGSHVLSLDAGWIGRGRVFLLEQPHTGASQPAGCIQSAPSAR